MLNTVFGVNAFPSGGYTSLAVYGKQQPFLGGALPTAKNHGFDDPESCYMMAPISSKASYHECSGKQDGHWIADGSSVMARALLFNPVYIGSTHFEITRQVDGSFRGPVADCTKTTGG